MQRSVSTNVKGGRSQLEVPYRMEGEKGSRYSFSFLEENEGIMIFIITTYQHHFHPHPFKICVALE